MFLSANVALGSTPVGTPILQQNSRIVTPQEIQAQHKFIQLRSLIINGRETEALSMLKDGITKDVIERIDKIIVDGQTVFAEACQRGHAGLVERLIELNVSLDQQNDSGETPLHIAYAMQNKHLVKQLVAAGASIDALPNVGRSVLEMVLDNRDFSFVCISFLTSSQNNFNKLIYINSLYK